MPNLTGSQRRLLTPRASRHPVGPAWDTIHVCPFLSLRLGRPHLTREDSPTGSVLIWEGAGPERTRLSCSRRRSKQVDRGAEYEGWVKTVPGVVHSGGGTPFWHRRDHGDSPGQGGHRRCSGPFASVGARPAAQPVTSWAAGTSIGPGPQAAERLVVLGGASVGSARAGRVDAELGAHQLELVALYVIYRRSGTMRRRRGSWWRRRASCWPVAREPQK